MKTIKERVDSLQEWYDEELGKSKEKLRAKYARKLASLQIQCTHPSATLEKDAGYHGSVFDEWECPDCKKYEHR